MLRRTLVEYPGRPQGVTQRVHLTALGGSSATPAAGLTALNVDALGMSFTSAGPGSERG